MTAGFEIRFWTLDGREQPELARPGGTFGAFARPTVDGRIVAVLNREPEIQSVEPGSERLVLATHDPVWAVTADVSPDGRRAATGGGTGMLRLWWITWPDLVARMCASTSACLSVAERIELLDEDDNEAGARFTACERARGR